MDSDSMKEIINQHPDQNKLLELLDFLKYQNYTIGYQMGYKNAVTCQPVIQTNKANK